MTNTVSVHPNLGRDHKVDNLGVDLTSAPGKNAFASVTCSVRSATQVSRAGKRSFFPITMPVSLAKASLSKIQAAPEVMQQAERVTEVQTLTSVSVEGGFTTASRPVPVPADSPASIMLPGPHTIQATTSAPVSAPPAIATTDAVTDTLCGPPCQFSH